LLVHRLLRRTCPCRNFNIGLVPSSKAAARDWMKCEEIRFTLDLEERTDYFDPEKQARGPERAMGARVVAALWHDDWGLVRSEFLEQKTALPLRWNH
jgi:hypothetical protein